MIEKLGLDVRSIDVTQISTPQEEITKPVPEPAQQEQAVSHTAQEQMIATERKQAFVFTGSLNRAALDAQLGAMVQTEKAAPAVGATSPNDLAGIAAWPTLKPGSSGFAVEHLQYELNKWIESRNKELPDDQKMPNVDLNGVYSQETEQAVKAYQKSMGLEETGVADAFIQKGLKLEDVMRDSDLNAETRNHIRSSYVVLKDNPAGQDNLIKLAENRNFEYLLSPTAQSAAIDGLMQSPGSPVSLKMVEDVVFDAAALEKNPAFQNLPPATKEAALNTIFFEPFHGGMLIKSSGLSTVSSLVTSPEFGWLQPKQQEHLLEIVRANPALETPLSVGNLLTNTTFQLLDSKMQTRILDIAYHNTMVTNTTGGWPKDDGSVLHVDDLIRLLNDPTFQEAEESEKYAQLNAMKNQMPSDGGQVDFAS